LVLIATGDHHRSPNALRWSCLSKAMATWRSRSPVDAGRPGIFLFPGSGPFSCGKRI